MKGCLFTLRLDLLRERIMNRSSLLAIAIAVCVLPFSSSYGFGQNANDQANIVAAGVNYVRQRFVEHKLIPERAAIALEPHVLAEGLRRGPQNRARAEQVARLAGVRIATREETVRCGPEVPGQCHMNVDALVQFSEPDIQGETATVRVTVKWYNPALPRNRAPSMMSELTLVRLVSGWTVTKHTDMMVS
jgi:hypothetical protein